MRSLTRPIVTALLTFACAAISHAAWDWKPIANATPTGFIRTAKVAAATSAVQVLKQSAAELEAVWAARPTLLGGIADEADTTAQAPANITAWGDKHRGVVIVSLAPGNGPRTATVTVLHDLENTFAQSYPDLLKAAGLDDGGGGAAVPAVDWETVQLYDGSGSLRMPKGWTIYTANKGSVDASGPHGSISLGASFLVATPQSYQASYPGVIVSDYTDPVRVMNAAAPIFKQRALQSNSPWWELGKVNDQKALDWPGQVTAIIDRDIIVHTAEGPKTYRGIFLISLGQVMGGNFTFYQSLALCERDKFQAHMPILLNIWKSWGIKEEVFRARFEAAMTAMRECEALYKQIIDDRIASSERRSDAVGALLHGGWPMNRNDFGGIEKAVKELNRRDHIPRVRAILWGELNQ